MPIYTESLTKFWGEGSETILEWATDGNEGVFFKRIFGCESQDVSEEEMEKRTDCCRLGDMWCSVKKKEDGIVSLYMNTIRNIPVGAFEKIARQFPNLHADGIFIHQTEEFFGSYVIENGQFFWTQFHNPGKRSGDPDFQFDSFFESDLEKISDEKQRAVLKGLGLERRMLHGEKPAKKELKSLLKEFRDEKNKDANIGFYFSTEEKKALTGDKASQNKLSKDIRNSYYDDKSIYNEDDTERVDLHKVG